MIESTKGDNDMKNGKPTQKGKNPRGRPIERVMPPSIPDTAENIAKAILTTPPKKPGEWKYLKK